MPADMDRSILHFRIGQKPYYEIENGNLALKSSDFTQSVDINQLFENYYYQTVSALDEIVKSAMVPGFIVTVL